MSVCYFNLPTAQPPSTNFFCFVYVNTDLYQQLKVTMGHGGGGGGGGGGTGVATLVRVNYADSK